jgi:hypothetical protein
MDPVLIPITGSVFSFSGSTTIGFGGMMNVKEISFA